MGTIADVLRIAASQIGTTEQPPGSNQNPYSTADRRPAESRRWRGTTFDERFWQRINFLGQCWEWTGTRGRHGYGVQGRTLAHRYVYEYTCGPIPAGMQLDHLCRNRGCVNPGHLEPVTQRENILRGESPAAQAARRDACIHGHEYTSENTYMRLDGRGRQCRRCKAMRERDRQRRLAA